MGKRITVSPPRGQPPRQQLHLQVHDPGELGQRIGLRRALTTRKALFGDFYVNMVRSGEASGQMSQVLERLVAHMNRIRALRESVVSATIYPAILLGVALLSREPVGEVQVGIPGFEDEQKRVIAATVGDVHGLCLSAKAESPAHAADLILTALSGPAAPIHPTRQHLGPAIPPPA